MTQPKFYQSLKKQHEHAVIEIVAAITTYYQSILYAVNNAWGKRACTLYAFTPRFYIVDH